MTKLLSLLSLTTALSTASVLPLVQENNNQTISINQTNQIAVIDNINQSLKVTAKPGFDEIFDLYDSEFLILDLPWEKVKTITTGVATNFFSHSVSSGTKISNQLQLKLVEDRENPTPDSIMLAGLSMSLDTENNQLSDIFISIHLYKHWRNPNASLASFNILVHANTFGATEGCSTFCMVDKIILK